MLNAVKLWRAVLLPEGPAGRTALLFPYRTLLTLLFRASTHRSPFETWRFFKIVCYLPKALNFCCIRLCASLQYKYCACSLILTMTLHTHVLFA